ncbi:MAG TPA: alpha/beta fold hydrolase [Stellaceae bacterium]|nr:alpha/beta fold hydrolase [Stellaceae bacterium]
MPASPLDRRLMPRPLPAHLASAILLWLTSRAALRNCTSALPSSSAPGNPGDDRLAALAGEIRELGPEKVAPALDCELRRRAAAFLAGLQAYRRHPFHRAPTRVPIPWRHGAARLLDYGSSGGTGPVVLIVPSLINRHYILDLLRERSFVCHLAGAGLRPLVLDWGEPGAAERWFTLSDYIAGPLAHALAAAVTLAEGPVALLGYCMGGLLALAAAVRRPAEIACLALLATPWDFHAERRSEAGLLGSLVEFLPLFCGAADPVPVSVIQTLFMALDPFLSERKFIRFAGLDSEGAAARGFVALEDWINDGVPLARPVALECARSWYRDNDPAKGLWQVAGRPVRPTEVSAPTLVVLPSRDRIVPPRSAAPLAAAIPHAAILRPPFGHIGMMASLAAPDAVWRPIALWLKGQFG